MHYQKEKHIYKQFIPRLLFFFLVFAGSLAPHSCFLWQLPVWEDRDFGSWAPYSLGEDFIWVSTYVNVNILHTWGDKGPKTPIPVFPLDWQLSLACGWCYWGWPFSHCVSECFCWLWGFGREGCGWGQGCGWCWLRVCWAVRVIWEQRKKGRGRLTSWGQVRKLQRGNSGRPPGCCDRALMRTWSWLGQWGTSQSLHPQAWSGCLSGFPQWNLSQSGTLELGWSIPPRASGQSSEVHGSQSRSPGVHFSAVGIELPKKNTELLVLSQSPPPPPPRALLLPRPLPPVWHEAAQCCVLRASAASCPLRQSLGSVSLMAGSCGAQRLCHCPADLPSAPRVASWTCTQTLIIRPDLHKDWGLLTLKMFFQCLRKWQLSFLW